MNVPNVTLRDGRSMPQFGFGLWQVDPADAAPAISEALRVGYRSIDTASLYHNEEGVGEAFRASGLRREEVFITTKVWSDRHEDTAGSLAESLGRLQMDYVDLFLIHWPSPLRGNYRVAWKGLIELQKTRKAVSIGTSNFNIDHLERIIEETGVVPVINQVELHPLLQQRELREFHAKHGIVTESWSPLGRGMFKDNPILDAIAAKHGKTPAQVVIRWHLDSGIVVIPRSINPARIRENSEVFDFRLDAEDMAQIATLHTGKRFGGNPATDN